MRRYLLKILVLFILIFIIFLVSNPIFEKDGCSNNCIKKGYTDGKCMRLPVIPNPCEVNGYYTDESYGQYCEKVEEGLLGSSNICCCYNK